MPSLTGENGPFTKKSRGKGLGESQGIFVKNQGNEVQTLEDGRFHGIHT